MEPIYVDIHIHTSENPNEINKNYNVDLLLSKIRETSNNSKTLLSLTDHNTINKYAYLELRKKTDNILIGVELHIKNYDSKPPYHCHIIFDIDDITEEKIDYLNAKLDQLYPNKIITPFTENVPKLETIINEFSEYEFILLPHGGQSHSTFDRSIPSDIRFDSMIERSLYYNQFDGFTARDNQGLDETQRYFKRLGIFEFVNLITCTDNYNPNIYPNAKASTASPFIPTWMLALPTFNGLRLSLSESDRFVYSDSKPSIQYEHLEKVFLQNDYIDIDIKLTPGLNVIIGGSSSGKTLLVDSIFKKLTNNFEYSDYKSLGVEEISVSNPSGMIPHYISQNYIVKVIDQTNENSGIEKIDLIKQVFPEDTDVTQGLRIALLTLRKDLTELIDRVKVIQDSTDKINRIPIPSRLIVESVLEKNLASQLLPPDIVLELYNKDCNYYDNIEKTLKEFKDYMKLNPFASNIDNEVDIILHRLKDLIDKVNFENKIRSLINLGKLEIDTYLSCTYSEQQRKNHDLEKLIENIRAYVKAKKDFDDIILRISNYSFTVSSKEITSMGHKLIIKNDFKLTKESLLDIVNRFLKTSNKIQRFEDLTPESLFENNFSGRNPKVIDYDDFISKIYSDFEKMNKRSYKITTKENKNFDELSAGWKTSVLLDLILGYESDFAPLIIDQPEDNLATDYINRGLIEAIKNIKTKKQIVLVSHNATIPMLGDAQNVILCNNENGKIRIRASELESSINNISIVDYIAKITDGGKSSIKKRVKKYNLKNFRGEDNED